VIPLSSLAHSGDRTVAAGGRNGSVAMWPARRGRTQALIGRLLITGFDTGLASGSSVARSGCGAVVAGTGAVLDRVRPPVRGPWRCVICTRTGSWVRTRGPRALPAFPSSAAEGTEELSGFVAPRGTAGDDSPGKATDERQQRARRVVHSCTLAASVASV
jgi:hypothetical protein